MTPPGNRRATVMLAAALSSAVVFLGTPSPAAAVNPIKPACTIVGWFSGIAGKTCTVLQKGASLLAKARSGAPGGAGRVAAKAAGLAAVVPWVVLGARAALRGTAAIIDHTSAPRLGTTWFASTYWRLATLATLLTVPFLLAAAVQAVLHSDLSLLMRAAFGYLPLALLAVGIAAPLTMLLLSASDEMSAIIAAAAGKAETRFLWRAGASLGLVTGVFGSPFLAVVVGVFTVAGALALWAEMLMREVAVYVVVLMLPLAFASMVWPARRVWAIRAVELLMALILSKFAVVAVLALGGAALGSGTIPRVADMLAGGVLVSLAAFAPWAMVRLLPLAEVASGAAGSLGRDVSRAGRAGAAAETAADELNAALEARRGTVGDFADLTAESDARAESERISSLTPIPGLSASTSVADAVEDLDSLAGLRSAADDEPVAAAGEEPAGAAGDGPVAAAGDEPAAPAPRGRTAAQAPPGKPVIPLPERPVPAEAPLPGHEPDAPVGAPAADDQADALAPPTLPESPPPPDTPEPPPPVPPDSALSPDPPDSPEPASPRHSLEVISGLSFDASPPLILGLEAGWPPPGLVASAGGEEPPGGEEPAGGEEAAESAPAIPPHAPAPPPANEAHPR